MQVTLREAGRMRRELENWLAAHMPEPVVGLEVYASSLADEVAAKRQELLDDVAQWDSVLEVLYGLRARVGAANAEAGVTDWLAHVNLAEREVSLYRSLATLEPAQPDVIVRGIEADLARRDKAERYYGGSEGVTHSHVLEQEDLDAMEAKLQQAQRRLRDLQDRLLRANMDNTVDLDDDWHDVLVEVGVL